MRARREKRYANDAKVAMEDDLSTANAEYLQWRTQDIQAQFVAACDTHATDHSTILTNSENAERALAYDLAVGVCFIGEEAMQELRVIADWRLLKELEKKNNPNRIFLEYFKLGIFHGMSLLAWVRSAGSSGAMPTEIESERTYKRPETN